MLKRLRTFETLIIFGLYFLPIVLWSVFGFSRMNPASHWTLFSLGLSLSCFGGIAIWLLTNREAENTPSLQPPLDSSRFPPLETDESLKQRIEKINPLKVEEDPEPTPPAAPQTIYVVDESLKIEKQMLEEQIEALKSAHFQELEQKAEELFALKEELSLKEKELHDSQEKAKELQSKIEELDYEIKALIDFNQESSFDDNYTLNELDVGKVLNKWIDVAGSLSTHPDWEGEIPPSPYQNLSKLIQDESQALVFLYNTREERIFGSNSYTLTLFGLTPEQFANKFHTLIPKDSLEWHEAKSKISQSKLAGIQLQGCHGTLGLISSGPLRGNYIGVAY